MHFTKTLLSLLALTTSHLVLSACIEIPPTTDPSTAQLPLTGDIPAKTIKPTLISQWSDNTVKYNTTFGLISKWQDTDRSSVLLTYDFPADAKGKTCEFSLYLERWAQVCPEGSTPPKSDAKCSGTFALFSSSQPAKPGATGNSRDQWIGVLQARTADMAEWVLPGSKPVRRACPTGTVGFELVGQGSFDYIYFPWSPGAKSLPAFTYS